MNLTINERLIRVKASAIPIENDLEMDEDLTFTVEGTVEKVEETNNHDGTKNVTYIVKGIVAYNEPIPTD